MASLFFKFNFFLRNAMFPHVKQNHVSRTFICQHLGILPKSRAKTDVTPVANFGMFWFDQFLTSEVSRLNDIRLRVADVYSTAHICSKGDMTRGSGGHQSYLPSLPAVPVL